MKNFLFGLICALTVSACTPDLIMASSKPVNLSNKDVAQIKSAMTYTMFDPNSAMFRNFQGFDAIFQDGHGERRACFEVNGKNRMGGYVGFKSYSAKKVGTEWLLLGEWCQRPA